MSVICMDDPLWSACLARVRHDFYHLPEYLALEARRQRAEPRGFIYREDDRLFLLPLLIRTVNELFAELHESEPIYDVISPYGYPGIVLSESARQSPAFIARALTAMHDSLRHESVCSVFLRMNPILSVGFPELFPDGYLKYIGQTVAVDLSLDDEALWRQIRRNCRTELNKLKREGFTPRWVTLADFLDPFRTLYSETMIRVGAKEQYHFDADYFDRLADIPDRVYCCLVENHGSIAAGCIFFETDGIVEAHLAGTMNAWLPHSPFLLVLYSAIEWSKSRGNRYLHLGGGVGCANDQLFQYKAGYSPQRFTFYTLQQVLNLSTYERLARLRFPEEDESMEMLTRSNFFPIYRTET